MRRVFVPDACVEGDRVRLTGAEAHYVLHVLRLAVGSRFSAVLPDGSERMAVVECVGESGVEAALGEEQDSGADPLVDVRIRPALVKARKLDLVIQKCTELGASEIGPVLCARSITRPDRDGAAHKLERWEKIALEAARQCGRRTAPKIATPIPLDAALAEIGHLGGTGLVLAPQAANRTARDRPLISSGDREPVSVLIGPEGGFTTEELDAAKAAGLREVGLGRRVLRAETAAIAICALLMHELGELA